MVLVEMEQAEDDARYRALRYTDRETMTFQTFVPTKDAYSTFAVAMKITQIVNTTKSELRDDTEWGISLRDLETARSFDGFVGADNVMQALGPGCMSEYIYEAEQRAQQQCEEAEGDCREH